MLESQSPTARKTNSLVQSGPPLRELFLYIYIPYMMMTIHYLFLKRVDQTGPERPIVLSVGFSDINTIGTRLAPDWTKDRGFLAILF